MEQDMPSPQARPLPPHPDQVRIVHEEPTGQVRLVAFERRFFDVMTRHFGDRFLRYREDWAKTSEFDLRTDFPLSLDLEVNASCNLKCIMCVMGAPDYVNPMAEEPLMDIGLYRRLMSEGEKMGLPAMTFGFLSEPLLCRDLAEMIRLAREAGVMDIRLGTNGLLLSAQISRALIDAGLTRLEVSVDAVNPDTYRRIRRGGRLDLVKQNIMDFIEAREKSSSGFPILRLSFLRLPQNESELDDFLAFWRDKADLFSIQEPIFFEGAPICSELNLIEDSSQSVFRCAQPWQRIVIRSNGESYPCCSIYGLAMKAGSVKESSVTDIWNQASMESLRKLHQEGRFKDNRVCRHCAVRSNLKIGTRLARSGREED